jgi:hypothetical protein
MKRILISAFIFFLVLSLDACDSFPVTPTPSQSVLPSSAISALPSISPIETETELPVGSQSPSPSQPVFVPDTHVPDVDLEQSEYIPNSGFNFFEDDNFIYFSTDNGATLVTYNKISKVTKTIPIYSGFFVSKGRVYYNDEGTMKSWITDI